MYASLWAPYWRVIRQLAGPPTLRDGRTSTDPKTREFYSLKHRAITYMVTPVEMGGLGLPPVIVAKIVGHSDAGQIIVKHYLKLDELAAVKMARDAMMRAAGHRPKLRAVGE